MEERTPLPTQAIWFAPWTWKPGHWLAAFIIVPPLYVLLVIGVEQAAKSQPENKWLRSVASIIGAPLRPIRPHAQYATLDYADIYRNCEVCGEPAVIRIEEGAIMSNIQAVRVRAFCDQHHQEYLDGPADALMPMVPLPPGMD